MRTSYVIFRFDPQTQKGIAIVDDRDDAAFEPAAHESAALCSKCGRLEAPNGQRYCRACHREYMRTWRKIHPLSEEQRKKDNCRSYAHVYLRLGRLVRRPCEVCGLLDSQMHHDDYSKPLEVRWLCRPCHLKLHKSHGSL